MLAIPRDAEMLLQEPRNALEDVKRVRGWVSVLFHPESFLGNESLWSVFRDVLHMCKDMGADVSGNLPERRTPGGSCAACV